MRRAWCGFYDHLVCDLGRHRHQAAFRDIRTRYLVLAPFGDPAGLLDFQNGSTGDAEPRNRVLQALCAVAKGSDQAADTSLVVVIVALWPGLDAVYRRLLRYFRANPDDLAAEIMARITGGIRGIDLTRVSRLAATLLMNLERDIRRSLAPVWAAAAKRADLTDDIPAPDHMSQFGFTAETGDALADTARLLARLEPLIGRDASLVVDVAVHGMTQQAAAIARGLTPEAGRKRHQRAMCQLRNYLDA
jgi:DNA-directed RNA polymerase specialized sigma24 family protein